MSTPHTIQGFGIDTITLAGPLEAKLAAMKAAGFTQVMLKANDINGHAGGIDAAVKAVKDSGLRGTGFQVLRDFEGLSGHLHEYKVDIAKSMLQMAAQALEVTQHLEAGATQSAGLDLGHRCFHAVGMADDVVGLQHHLGEAGVHHGLELGLQRPGQGDGVHAEALDGVGLHAVTSPLGRPEASAAPPGGSEDTECRAWGLAFSLCTSSNTTEPR